MDEDEGGQVGPLFPELPPPGPELAWWEVSAAFRDGDAPWPPPRYPEDVMAAHTARMTVLMVRAKLGSEALARAEGLLGLGLAEWRVRPARSSEVRVAAS